MERDGGLCKRKDYCSMAAYCKRVHPGIQKEFKQKDKQPSAIEVEIFKSQGQGANCTRS